MSTVDSINEAILNLKTEVTQRGDSIDKLGKVQAGSIEAKAAWHLNQALELLTVEEVTRDDQDESKDPAVPTEAGEEGEVSPEAVEETEAEATGTEVGTVFTGESAEAPADPSD